MRVESDMRESYVAVGDDPLNDLPKSKIFTTESLRSTEHRRRGMKETEQNDAEEFSWEREEKKKTEKTVNKKTKKRPPKIYPEEHSFFCRSSLPSVMPTPACSVSPSA